MVDPDAENRAVTRAAFDIGYCLAFRALVQSVLGIVDDFQTEVIMGV